MRTSWDSIPTQSHPDSPFSYDRRDRHNGKRGRHTRVYDPTQTRVKTRKGNKVTGGAVCDGDFGGWIDSNIYENPLDRVTRNGVSVEIAEHNRKVWAAKKYERKKAHTSKRKA